MSLAFHKLTWPFMNHMAQMLNLLTKVQVEEQFCILALATVIMDAATVVHNYCGGEEHHSCDWPEIWLTWNCTTIKCKTCLCVWNLKFHHIVVCVSLCSSFMILLKPLQSVHLFAGPWACGTKNHFQCEAQSATSEAFQGDVFTNAAVDWHTAVYVSNLEPFYLFIMESLFKGAQL